jgi:asparagine synthase (glutamine-hydrolysing)
MMQVTPAAPLERLVQLLPKRFRIPHLPELLAKLADVVSEESVETYYLRLVSHWQQPELVVRGGVAPQTLFDSPDRLPKLPGLRERMMYLDSVTYLPDDILTKVDRASMAVSLEARVPLLDHRVVEFAWRVPMSLKYRDGKGKWLLREVLHRYVPRELMERPKMGFTVPIDHWLRGPLREWAENLLDEKRLREEGFFEPAPIRDMWHEHVTGKRRRHFHLWDVLMFQSWLAEEKAR